MSIKQFHQELSNGLPAPVYLLYSTEDFLLYEALSAVRGRCDTTDGFNFNAYDCKSPDDDMPAEQIVDMLNTLPFLSERKTVVMKNIQKLPKKDVKKLEAYLANPSNTSLLVMLHAGAPPKLFDAAVLKGVKAVALSVQEKEIPLWVQAKAKKKGISLTDRAVEYLISIAGTDLGMLSAEIEKLSCWNSSSAIDIGDLKGTIYAGAEYNAFDLVDALKKGDAGEVFRIYEILIRSQEPLMLLGALNYQYSRQYSGQYSSAYTRQAAPAKDSAGALEVFRLLHEADVALKTSHKYVMEDLLVKLLRLKGKNRSV